MPEMLKDETIENLRKSMSERITKAIDHRGHINTLKIFIQIHGTFNHICLYAIFIVYLFINKNLH